MRGTIGLRLLILAILRTFHPFIQVGLSEINVSSEVGVGPTIWTLKLWVCAVLAL